MHKIPKKIPLDESRFLKVELVEPAALGGERGEWIYQDDPDDPCFGVARVDKTLDEFEKWVVFREELQHALIDFQRWILLDCPEEEEGEPTETGHKPKEQVRGKESAPTPEPASGADLHGPGI